MADRPTPPDPFRSAKVEKRSYSPAPQSGPASLHPAEKAVRDAAWGWVRKQLPTWGMVILLGGGSSFVGRDAKDKAQRDAEEASQAERAKLRRDLKDAQEELQEVAAELRKQKREQANTAAAHLELAQIVAKVKAQAENLEAAKTTVIRSQPDRAPR